MKCTCPRIKIGLRVTEHRNLSPNCELKEHRDKARHDEDVLFGRLRKSGGRR